MKNRLILTVAAAGLFLGMSQVAAQDETGAGNNQVGVETVRQEVREEVRQEAGLSGEIGEKNRQEAREEAREEIRESGENLKEVRVESLRQVRQTRQEIWENIERIREENRGLVEQNRLALKEQLGLLQDKNKAQTVERIYDNLNRLNDQIVTRLLAKIDQIEEVLERVKSRTDRAEEGGLEVKLVREEIALAEEAITNARQSAKEQAEKIYEITISNEANLRTDIKPVRDQLRNGLEALRQEVIGAREAVRKAVNALAQVRGIESLEVSPTLRETE